MAELDFSLLEKHNAARKKTSFFDIERMKTAEAETPQRIAERGTVWGDLGEKITAAAPGGGIDRPWEQTKDIGKAALTGLALPSTLIEGSIAGPTLQLQQDPTKPFTSLQGMGEMAMSGLKGLTGIEQPKYEDVYRNTGMPEGVATGLGIATNIATSTAIINQVSKYFGGLTKLSDRKLEQASQGLVSGGQKALDSYQKVDDAAYAAVDDAASNVKELTTYIDEAGETVKNAFMKKFGIKNMDDITDAPVKYVRKIKQWLGKLKPNSFDKGRKGFQENVTDDAVITLYGNLKKIIRKSVQAKYGTKAADVIDKADDAFSRAIDAFNVIKRGVVDPKLPKEFTGGAQFARTLMGVGKGASTARKATDILRKAGRIYGKELKESIRLLKHFERMRTGGNIGKWGVRTGILAGGIAGLNRAFRGKQKETYIAPSNQGT